MESDEPDVFAALMKAGRIKKDGGRLVVTAEPTGIEKRLRDYRVWNRRSACYDAVPLTLDAADEIKRLVTALTETERRARALAEQLHDHIRTLIDEDPSEPIADNGMTVLDGWRELALILLRGR